MEAGLFSFYHLASCVPHTISNNSFGNVMMFIAFNTISIIVSTHNKDIRMSRGHVEEDEDWFMMRMVTVVRMRAMF